MEEEMKEENALDVSDEFERHPKLNDEMRKKGDSAIVNFLNNGKLVKVDKMSSETLAKLREKKIKARDNFVFLVETKDGEKREFWMGAQNYTNRRELKEIAKEVNPNKPTLENVMVRIERIAEASPSEPNFKFELYKEG